MKWTATGAAATACMVLTSVLTGCDRDIANATPAAEPPPASPAVVTPAAATVAAAEPAPLAQKAAARVAGEGFELAAEAKGPYTAGKPSTFDIVLVAKDGYKCNDQYPYKFKAQDTPDVEFSSKVVGADALKLEKHRAVMSVAFTPKAAGEKSVAGQFSFSVCTDERCLVERRDLALPIEVK